VATAIDFPFDDTADARRLRFLNLIDDHSRFCLGIRGCRRIKATGMVAHLETLPFIIVHP
jgi:hypothetical protein